MGNTNRGFILTSDQRDIAGKSCLEFWLVSADGPIKVSTAAQQALFFISQQDVAQVQDILAQSNIPSTFKALSLNRLADRYLMERFIYASADIIGHKQEGGNYPSYAESQLKPAQYTPTFSVLSIDIECSEHGELYSIGLVSADYQKVLMIGEAQEGPAWIEWIDDEKMLIQQFIHEVQHLDPDILIGWNVVNFDFRLLIERAQRYGLKLTLGRGNEAVYWRDAPNEVNQGYISMPGRVVIDGIDALKTATYQFSSFSLEFVAQTLLGKGKLSEDVDDRLAQIKHDFLHNKVKLAEYNLQDCQLVLDIFAKTKVLDFLTLRSQLTGLELNRVGGSVAAFINLYLPKLHRAGYISPNRPVDGGLASPGGYVMTSQPGLYRNVLVLDFKSLYPSIIRTFKIDPLGLVEGLRQPEEAIQGFKDALFSREQHFLPDIITSLWQQRDTAKRHLDGARSQAIKILMNSFYGVLGSGGCPFYDTRLASSITLRGHEIMQTTARWVEDLGYRVIYGDTDSIFVWLGDDMQAAQGHTVGTELQCEINRRWTRNITEHHQLESYLEIEFETQFSRFLMPTIRGSELGSKKRYAGLKLIENNEDELIFKGLESVRSDWTDMAKAFQLVLYQRVFADKDVKSYIREVVAQTRNGELDEQLVYHKRIRRPLSQYVKNIPPHVKAARLADEHNAQRNKPLRYQHKGQIAYVITLNGAQPIEYQSSALDYEHYIDKQIRPIAESILPFIGLSFSDITSAQLGLFE